MKFVSVESSKSSALASPAWLAVAGSVARALKRSLNDCRSGPIFTENVSPQSKALVGIGVKRGDVVLAGARNLKAGLGEGGDHARTVLDLSLGDAVEKPVVDDLSGLAAPRQFDQADDIPSPRGVLGICPAMALVFDIAERVERLLVARGRNVEAAPTGQLHPGCHEVELDPVLVCVSHPEDIPPVTLQAGERQSLEGVHHVGLLALGRDILPREGQDA